MASQMFDIGFPELIMIFVVALVVVGPKQLPELGKRIGKALSELKRSLDGVKAQVTAEMEMGREEKAKDTFSDLPPPPENLACADAGKSEAPIGSEVTRKEGHSG
jgi:Tat protein translocase TatB subunit